MNKVKTQRSSKLNTNVNYYLYLFLFSVVLAFKRVHTAVLCVHGEISQRALTQRRQLLVHLHSLVHKHVKHWVYDNILKSRKKTHTRGNQLIQKPSLLWLTFLSPRSRIASMSSSVISLSLDANTCVAPWRIMESISSLPSLLALGSTSRPDKRKGKKQIHCHFVLVYRVAWSVYHCPTKSN